MLAAANLNFVAFWRFGPEPQTPTGVMVAIFSIAIAAAEAAVGLALVALFVAALASEEVTRSLGRTFNRVLRPVNRRITSFHEVGVDEFIRDQRVRIVAVVRHGWLKMTFGMMTFFVVFYVLFWQCMHAVGLQMAFSHLFAAYARGRLLSAVGTTPGGVGVTEGERGCRPGRLRRRPGESPGRCRAPSRCSHTSWRSRWTRWPFSAGA